MLSQPEAVPLAVVCTVQLVSQHRIISQSVLYSLGKIICAYCTYACIIVVIAFVYPHFYQVESAQHIVLDKLGIRCLVLLGELFCHIREYLFQPRYPVVYKVVSFTKALWQIDIFIKMFGSAVVDKPNSLGIAFSQQL